MTLLQRFKNWWKKNVIRHGEDEDISRQTGLSEGDMSDKISDADWEIYLNSLPEFYRSLFTKEDFEKALKDKDNVPLQGDTLKIMAAILATYFGARGLFDGQSDQVSDNDMLLKSLYGDAYTPGNNKGFLSGIKDLFSGFSDRFGSGLSGIGSALLGIGSEFGSSILNYQNQVRLIDKQNAYNTPKAQMDRFSQAGLNPNLIYGLGSNGNQPASGSVAPVDFDTAQRENRMAQMQIVTQTKLADAEIASKQADVQLKNTQSQQVAAQTAYQQLVNNNYLTQLRAELDNLAADTDKLRQEKQILEHETHTAEVKARIATIEEDIAKNEKIISDMKAEYAEATAFTEMLGNLVGFNFGLGMNFGRSRSTVRSFKGK